MKEIWTMGELLVEIMRPCAGASLQAPDVFLGPFPSGAPAIFIDTAARLGCKAGIIGCVGNDHFGRCVLDRLRYDGVNIENVTVAEEGTTACAFVTYNEDGSREFIYHLSNTPAVKAKMPNLLPKRDLGYFHIMGCSLMAGPSFCDEIIKTAQMHKAAGASISFDPNIRPELLGSGDIHKILNPVMEMCEVLLPGAKELMMITGKNSVEEAVKYVFDIYPVKIIALKLGADGCAIHTRERAFTKGIYNVEVKDPTGAGDCFDAAFLYSLLEERTLEECAEIASAAAALNTAAFGPMEGNISRASVWNMINGR